MPFNHPLIHDVAALLLAVLLGGVVGMERERTEHPAGLRTHILVCVGATLITLVDQSLPSSGSKITAQIVTGVGFLGAGTILREASGTMVRGLTTAATIWAVAGIGIAIGVGGVFMIVAIAATLIVFLTLGVLGRLDEYLNRNRLFQELTFVIATDKDPLQRMGDALNSLHQLGIRTGQFHIDAIQGGQVVHVTLRLPTLAIRDQVKPTLQANPNIVHVEWGPGG